MNEFICICLSNVHTCIMKTRQNAHHYSKFTLRSAMYKNILLAVKVPGNFVLMKKTDQGLHCFCLFLVSLWSMSL